MSTMCWRLDLPVVTASRLNSHRHHTFSPLSLFFLFFVVNQATEKVSEELSSMVFVRIPRSLGDACARPRSRFSEIESEARAALMDQSGIDTSRFSDVIFITRGVCGEGVALVGEHQSFIHSDTALSSVHQLLWAHGLSHNNGVEKFDLVAFAAAASSPSRTSTISPSLTRSTTSSRSTTRTPTASRTKSAPPLPSSASISSTAAPTTSRSRTASITPTRTVTSTVSRTRSTTASRSQTRSVTASRTRTASVTPSRTSVGGPVRTEIICGSSVVDNLFGKTSEFFGNGTAPGPDISYSFQVATTTQVTLSLCQGSDPNFDSALAVLRSGSGGTFTVIASNDDGCGVGGLSRLTTTLTPGSYVVVVDSFSNSPTNAYRLTVTCL
eukprot:c11025_g1_i1.p1 GENE.c11025_g1_i1~~c11025_g1_i1.p1  ORF type:complete len:383 (-),score=37.07 c11025_g1_i1:16-1164(-)